MKAVQIARTGGPEVLDLVELPTPAPGPGEVLVRAHAIGVGMPDVLVRTGRYAWMPPLPAVIGIEMSGHVVALGEGVTSLAVGDAVFASARELPVRGNCYAEYLCARADALYPLPAGVDLDAAACLSNYQVAWHLLHSAPNGAHYQSVLAWAAAGGVGSAVVELAALAGKRVVGVAGGAAKCDFVRSLGAADCIDYKSGDITQRVGALTAGQGFDLVLDPVGGPDFGRNFGLVAPLGLVVNYGILEGPPDPAYAAALYARFGDSVALRFFSMHVFDRQPQRRRAAMAALVPLLAQGRIRPVIAQRLALSEARRAHQLFESGAITGKLLLHP